MLVLKTNNIIITETQIAVHSRPTHDTAA